MILIDLATAGLPNTNMKHAVKSLCLTPRKGGISRMVNAQSSVLNHQHFNISCGNEITKLCLLQVDIRLTFSLCCKCGNKYDF